MASTTRRHLHPGRGGGVNVRQRGRIRRREYTEGGEVGRRTRPRGTDRQGMLKSQREHEVGTQRRAGQIELAKSFAQRGLRVPGLEQAIKGDEEKKPYVRRGARVSRELVRDVRVPGPKKYITRAESAEIGQRQRARESAAGRARGRPSRIQYQAREGGPRIDQTFTHGGKYYGYKGEEGVPDKDVRGQYGRTLETALGMGQESRIRGAQQFVQGLERQRAQIAPYAGAQPTPTAAGAATPTAAADQAAPMGDEQIIAELARVDSALRQAEASPGTPTTAGQAGFMGEYQKLLAYRSQLQGLQQSRRAQAEAAHAQEMAAIPGRPSAELSPLPSDTARTWADPRIEEYDRNVRAAQQQLGAEQTRMGQIPSIAAAEAAQRYQIRPPGAPLTPPGVPPTGAQAVSPMPPPATVDVTAMGITPRTLPRPDAGGFGAMTQLPETPDERMKRIVAEGAQREIDTATESQVATSLATLEPHQPNFEEPTTWDKLSLWMKSAVMSEQELSAGIAEQLTAQITQYASRFNEVPPSAKPQVAQSIINRGWFRNMETVIATAQAKGASYPLLGTMKALQAQVRQAAGPTAPPAPGPATPSPTGQTAGDVAGAAMFGGVLPLAGAAIDRLRGR